MVKMKVAMKSLQESPVWRQTLLDWARDKHTQSLLGYELGYLSCPQRTALVFYVEDCEACFSEQPSGWNTSKHVSFAVPRQCYGSLKQYIEFCSQRVVEGRNIFPKQTCLGRALRVSVGAWNTRQVRFTPLWIWTQPGITSFKSLFFFFQISQHPTRSWSP